MFDPTLAMRGMVTCPHALASAAGVDALRAGGSAVDAAIAASAVARRPLPAHDRHRRRCLLADLRRQGAQGVATSTAAAAPRAAATLERFAGAVAKSRSAALLPATLTTPGAVASFCEAHARLRPPAARALPAGRDRLCARRLPGDRAARALDASRRAPELDESFEAAIDSSRRKAPARQLLRNSDLARTLRGASRRTAAPASTRARWRTNCCAEATAASSPSATSRRSGAYWGEPIRGTYRGVTIYETPAPTQGFTVLEMLNLLEPLDLGKPFLGPDHVHLLVQAKQIAYHDRDRWLADPRFAEVPMERLISKAYADERRTLIDPQARAAVGQGALLRQPDRRHGLRRRRRRRGQRRLADPFSLYGIFGACVTCRPRPASCCRTAAPTSRSTRSIPTGSSRARRRCTR